MQTLKKLFVTLLEKRKQFHDFARKRRFTVGIPLALLELVVLSAIYWFYGLKIAFTCLAVFAIVNSALVFLATGSWLLVAGYLLCKMTGFCPLP